MRFLRYSVIFLRFIINMSSYWVHDLKSFCRSYNTRLTNLRVSSSFYSRNVALVWYVAVLGYLYLPEPNGKIRHQNPEPKLWRFRKSFRVRIRTFPNDYQHQWLFVSMVTNGHRPVEVYYTDRYQWQPGQQRWPMEVSAAEGRSERTSWFCTVLERSCEYHRAIEVVPRIFQAKTQNTVSFFWKWLWVHWSVCKLLEPKNI